MKNKNKKIEVEINLANPDQAYSELKLAGVEVKLSKPNMNGPPHHLCTLIGKEKAIMKWLKANELESSQYTVVGKKKKLRMFEVSVVIGDDCKYGTIHNMTACVSARSVKRAEKAAAVAFQWNLAKDCKNMSTVEN